MMKWITDRWGHMHQQLTAEEARQARYGKPIFYVLVGGLFGSIVGLAVAGYYIS
jgi:hypothetical protein